MATPGMDTVGGGSDGGTLDAMINVGSCEEVRHQTEATPLEQDGRRRMSTEYWEGRQGRDYVCPVCKKNFTTGEFWIQCDVCREWYHGDCVYIKEYEANQLDKFHCLKCEQEYGPSVPKPVTNRHRHDRTEDVNAANVKPVQSGTEEFVCGLKKRQFVTLSEAEGGTLLLKMRGHALTLPVLMKKGFNVPILIESKEGLEMSLPTEEQFTVDEAMKWIGANYELDVIDVTRQISVRMPMINFVRSIGQEEKNRTNTYNCISLEVSKTPLGRLIKPPSVVNRLSWVERCWPKDSELKPAVSKYCLMSMANSFTDFHVDFGGTSVWYHVLKGEKMFYFIEPTPDNLKAYEQWMHLKNQSEVFFPDRVDACYMQTLRQGETMLIPTGWIHAVLTLTDSIVFGGNFLHSLNIKLQLGIREMETRIKTPDKFQFPFFELTHWYASPSILKLLQDNVAEKYPPKYLVDGVRALVEALRVWLNKSTTEKNGSSGSISTYAPLGLNCRKLIKDLNKALKRAEKHVEGQPVKRKSRKSFDLSSEANSTSEMKQDSGHACVVTTGRSDDESNSSKLVVDDKLKVAISHHRIEKGAAGPKRNERLHSSDSETKGVIKMKLSLCGKSGLPEVTEATLTPPFASHTLSSDEQAQAQDQEQQQQDAMHSDFLNNSTKTGSSAPQGRTHAHTHAKHEAKKMKKITAAQKAEEDLPEQEILDMIRGRPQDGDFIYLDVGTGIDEDVSTRGRNKSVARDEAWTPRAKVVMRGTPKVARPVRENAIKREVVESTMMGSTCTVDAEHVTHAKQKRPYNRKKPRKSLQSSDSVAASPVQPTTATANAQSTDEQSMFELETSWPVISKAGPSNSTEEAAAAAAAALKAKKASKPRKGLKTAKQRLAKAMKIKPKF